MIGASFELNPSPVFSNGPVERNTNTHSGSSFSPLPLKSLHLSPLLKRACEWMRHHRQWGCHGDSRSVWAGFLSWPLVKQTSKVSRQSHSLVLTASFTSSTASITPEFSEFIRPGITRCHLSTAPAVYNRSLGHCDGKSAPVQQQHKTGIPVQTRRRPARAC